MHQLEPLSLFIRWAHVVGMAAMAGGALLVWALTTRSSGADPGDRAKLQIAQRYEWIFWVAIGVQVMTGVGNLGAFGQGLPTASTAWGLRFTAKLVAVLILAILSVPRTLAISAAAASRLPEPAATVRVVHAFYTATLLLALTIVALAVWLAHG